MLSISSGASVGVTFRISAFPRSVVVSLSQLGGHGGGSRIGPVRAGNPTSFTVTEPVGRYATVIRTVWPQGRATYRVELDLS